MRLSLNVVFSPLMFVDLSFHLILCFRLAQTHIYGLLVCWMTSSILTFLSSCLDIFVMAKRETRLLYLSLDIPGIAILWYLRTNILWEHVLNLPFHGYIWTFVLLTMESQKLAEKGYVKVEHWPKKPLLLSTNEIISLLICHIFWLLSFSLFFKREDFSCI